jgi:hypothetical protein
MRRKNASARRRRVSGNAIAKLMTKASRTTRKGTQGLTDRYGGSATEDPLPPQQPRPEHRTKQRTQGHHPSVPEGDKGQRVVGTVKGVGNRP